MNKIIIPINPKGVPFSTKFHWWKDRIKGKLLKTFKIKTIYTTKK